MPHVVHVGFGVTLLYTFVKFVLPLVVPSAGTLPGYGAWATAVALYVAQRHLRPFFTQRLPIAGSVVVTGCDSGIGEKTAHLLARKGFYVYAGILNPKSADLYEEEVKAGTLTPLQMDITSEESVKEAVATVEKDMKKRKDNTGLTAVVNVAGLGYIGPADFFPVKFYQHQLEVNLVGPYRVTQAFLPLIKRAVCKPSAERRGRLLFFGTGGGVPSPAPPLLTAYMGSKWGNEALCQGLRVEMQLVKKPIDACMINPGFVKPTALAPVGKKLLEKTLSEMGKEAADEWRPLINKFVEFSEQQPGTRPEVVADAVLEALVAGTPKLRYKVGFDSHVSPLVGLLPTAWREWLLKKSMYNQ